MTTTQLNGNGASSLRKATRQKAKMRLGVSGPSGTGKTYSALKIASGMTSLDKVAVIDTENGSADLYAHLGPYSVLPITAPYEPEKYIAAIKECERAGMEVIIIDSITHEWNGKGGCLEIHEAEVQKMRIPNSFTAWAKVTPRHQAFIDAILQASVHIITTVRSKTDYVLTEKNGKQIPQKVGLSAVTRDGFEYELTLSLDLDIDHKASASKDRTGLFMGSPGFIPSEETGKKILQWCESGAEPIKQAGAAFVLDPIEKIKKCGDIKELAALYNSMPPAQQGAEHILKAFTEKKQSFNGQKETIKQ